MKISVAGCKSEAKRLLGMPKDQDAADKCTEILGRLDETLDELEMRDSLTEAQGEKKELLLAFREVFEELKDAIDVLTDAESALHDLIEE